MTNPQDREAQDIEELLPWYEKGTLDPAGMRRVGDYLRSHPEMQFRLGLVREELAETVAANESLGMPGAAVRDRLFAAIAAEPAAAPLARTDPKGWWRTWLPKGMSPRLGLAVAAGCIVIAVQAAALIALTLAPPDRGYRIASGDMPEETQPGSYLLIRFTDDAKAADITALLKQFNAVVVGGPKPGGVFKIRVWPSSLSEAEREMMINKLREKSDIVSFVAPTG